jgi:hypothetical protein
MSAEDRKLATGLFALLFFASAYFFGGCGFNQNSTFDLTRALVEQRTITIDHYAGNTTDVSLYRQHLYVNKAPGLSFLSAIPYALTPRPHSVQAANIALYICTIASCAGGAALAGVLLFVFALRMGRTRREATIVALLSALATPMLPWSTVLFAHVPSAALMLVSFYYVSGLGPRRPMLAGAAIGLAATMNYLCVVVAAIFGLLLLVTSKRRLTEAGQYALGGLPFALGLTIYQRIAFGSFFRTSIETEHPRYITPGAFLGVFLRPSGEALWGITFSAYRGLFYLCPLLLLSVPGALLMWRRREWRWPLGAILATVGFFLLFNASFNAWAGGWGIGPRYILPIVPLLAVLMIPALGRLRPVWIATALLSLFFNIAATAVDPQVPERVEDPLSHYVLPALFTGQLGSTDDVLPGFRRYYTGHTSISRVTVDDGMPFRLHKPGTPETEWASFNLGELIFGAGSLMSLLPFLLIAGAASGFLVWRAGVPPAAAGLPARQ